MRAVVFDGQLQLLRQYSDPVPGPGEVRIRTSLAGICNTDLEIVRGYAAFRGVLGHEFVGVVDQASDARLVGRRVVGEINVSCGTCPACRAGRQTHCSVRTALGIRGRDGCLAEFFCLPESNLHLIPESLSDELAVFAEPLAAACQVLDQTHVHPTDRVIVLGDGKLGLLVAQVLALAGADVLAIGRHAEKLAILEARGIPTLLGDGGWGESADLVVECTGHPDGFLAARNMVRPGGRLVLKSTYHGLVEADLSSLVVDEVQVVGSRCGPFEAALRLLERRWVDVSSLITDVYPLDGAADAFEHAARRGALKVLVRP